MNNILSAGAGRADITPEVGGLLYGYNDDTVSYSCHDPLEIKALALSGADGDRSPVLLLSFSVGDFGTGACTETRQVLARETGLPMTHILASATHTHSAPNVSGVAGWGDVDRPYLETILIPGAVRAAKEALASLQPAEFAVSAGESDVGINRRELTESGEVILGQNPWGTQDKTMTVIRFRNAETKKGIFQLVHYGCHGTAAGNNHEITRDWIGVMTDRLEAETGIPTGFWNGCVGDIGPRIANRKTTGDIRYAEELGGKAALDAVRIAAPLDRALYERTPLYVHAEELVLPCRPLPPMEAVAAYTDEHPRDEHHVNIDGMIHAYMHAAHDLYLAGKTAPDSIRLPVSVIALGESVAFCPVPYELFSEICLRLRRHSPIRHTLAVSLTNGFAAYLPTKDAVARGGYEVACFRYDSTSALSDDTDTVLIGHFLRILRGLSQTTTDSSAS